MQKKPKILFLVQLPPPIHGVTMMNDITVNSLKLKEVFEAKVLPMNYTTEIKGIGKFSWKKLFSFVINYFKIIRSVIKIKPDLIYFTLTPTGLSFYRDLLIVGLLKLFRSKIIYHLHGKGIKGKTENSKINKAIYNWVFNNTYVIHLSKGLINDLSNLKVNFKYYPVSNGIDKNKLINKKDKNQTLTLLFLSNIAENKGVYMFLKSCLFLKENDIEFKGVIVGKQTTLISKEVINKKIKELDLINYVNYLGPKYDFEKEETLSKAHIFIFPTYNDCFPLVLLEAQKFGLPIISTNEGAIPEIVDDAINGFVVERKNQKELNKKVLELVTNKELIKEFSENSRIKFESFYTSEIYERSIISALTNIAND